MLERSASPPSTLGRSHVAARAYTLSIAASRARARSLAATIIGRSYRAWRARRSAVTAARSAARRARRVRALLFSRADALRLASVPLAGAGAGASAGGAALCCWCARRPLPAAAELARDALLVRLLRADVALERGIDGLVYSRNAPAAAWVAAPGEARGRAAEKAARLLLLAPRRAATAFCLPCRALFCSACFTAAHMVCGSAFAARARLAPGGALVAATVVDVYATPPTLATVTLRDHEWVRVRGRDGEAAAADLRAARAEADAWAAAAPPPRLAAAAGGAERAARRADRLAAYRIE
jgi:hypothetical protein